MASKSSSEITNHSPIICIKTHKTNKKYTKQNTNKNTTATKKKNNKKQNKSNKKKNDINELILPLTCLRLLPPY